MQAVALVLRVTDKQTREEDEQAGPVSSEILKFCSFGSGSVEDLGVARQRSG